MVERAGINLGREAVPPRLPIDRGRSFTILSILMCFGSRAYTIARVFTEPTLTAVCSKHWARSVTMMRSVLISHIPIVRPSSREDTNKNKRFIALRIAAIRGQTWESIFQQAQPFPVLHW